MKKLFITLLAALTLFAAVPQMCFAEEPTTPPTVEQGEGDEGDDRHEAQAAQLDHGQDDRLTEDMA
mgnify:CR=1 FL=1